MGRRRRFPAGAGEKPKPYEAALNAVSILEYRVINACVRADFRPMDVVQFLFPQETVAIMQRAFPLIERNMWIPAAYTAAHDIKLDEPGYIPRVQFHIDMQSLQMLVPEAKCFYPDYSHPAYPAIASCIKQIVAIHQQYLKVRKVVDLFNDARVSVGAVRYYWPVMSMLLPNSHDIHQLAGSTSFREPNVALPLDLLRETAGIVMTGNMSPEKVTPKENVKFRVNGSSLFGVL